MAGANTTSKSKLYRTCVDCVKRLDQSVRTRSVNSVFSSETVLVRDKLRDSCERLLFLSPLEYGRKAEDLIWKKCFYEPIQLLRANKETLSEKQQALTHLLIWSASGYFHSYALRLQQEFGVETVAVQEQKPNTDKNYEWAVFSLVKAFIYLGDLARYALDFCDERQNKTKLAEHYYLQALAIKPTYGMPLNQLGTLYTDRNCGIDSVYYYMRCLLSEESFEGCSGNLSVVFNRASAQLNALQHDNDVTSNMHSKSDQVRRFYLNFVHYVHVLYEDNLGADLGTLQQHVIGGFESVLPYLKDTETTEETQLSWETLTHVVLIEIMLEHRLQSLAQSTLVDSVSSTIITSFVMIVDFAIKYLRNQLPRPENPASAAVANGVQCEDRSEQGEEVPELETKRKRSHLIRRRTRGSESTDEVEDEENGDAERPKTPLSEGSQEEDVVVLSSSSDDEAEGDGVRKAYDILNAKIKEETQTKPRVFALLSDDEKLEKLCDSSLLMPIKVLCDWFKSKPNLVASITDGYEQLLRVVATLLNLLPHEDRLSLDRTPLMHQWMQEQALPEDRAFRGIPALQTIHSALDFTKTPTDRKQETLLRLFCIRSFGHYLIRLNVPGFKYDVSSTEFVGPEIAKAPIVRPAHNGTEATAFQQLQKNQLMARMGKLRLKEELTQLAAVSWIPVYLVPDTLALITKLAVVRQLVGSQRFVTVVPQSVLRALDSSKKESSGAREAIRWLETATTQGSKYVRAQKPAEQTKLDAIDSVTTEIAELMSCCASLTRTVASSADGATVVVLLTSHARNSMPYKALTDAVNSHQLLGVTVSTVGAFYGRWQAHRKKCG